MGGSGGLNERKNCKQSHPGPLLQGQEDKVTSRLRGTKGESRRRPSAPRRVAPPRTDHLLAAPTLFQGSTPPRQARAESKEHRVKLVSNVAPPLSILTDRSSTPKVDAILRKAHLNDDLLHPSRPSVRLVRYPTVLRASIHEERVERKVVLLQEGEERREDLVSDGSERVRREGRGEGAQTWNSIFRGALQSVQGGMSEGRRRFEEGQRGLGSGTSGRR